MGTTEELRRLTAELGLEESTLELMRLLPLVYVAWSDGELQPEELGLILESAETLGIESEASLETLQGWLEEKPDDAFFKRGLKLLSYVVASMDEAEAEDATSDLTSLCESVAKAAGGLSGHRVRIEAKEQLALREVVMRLNLGKRPATRNTLNALVAKGGS